MAGETAAEHGSADERRAATIAGQKATLAARFGGRWDDAQTAQVERALGRQYDLAARLRRAPLGNADEPEIGFVPFSADRDALGGESR